MMTVIYKPPEGAVRGQTTADSYDDDGVIDNSGTWKKKEAPLRLHHLLSVTEHLLVNPSN